MPSPWMMFLATVCAMTVSGVSLTRVAGVYLAFGEQGRAVGILGAQRTSGAPLPGLLMLRIRLIDRALFGWHSVFSRAVLRLIRHRRSTKAQWS
jgi:hypothetical protein